MMNEEWHGGKLFYVPNTEGGLGLRNPNLLAKVNVIKRAIRLWMEEIHPRSETGRDSTQKPNDTLLWLSILRNQLSIAACANCDGGYRIQRTLPYFLPSKGNIHNFFIPSVLAENVYHTMAVTLEQVALL